MAGIHRAESVSLRRITKSSLRRGNGQALIVAMLVLPLFFSVCALVVDGTNLMVNKRQMQNASDAAALAAGQELVPAQTAADACTGNSACLVAVQGNAALYGPVASAAQDYVEKNWRGSDPPTLTRCSSADETNCWSWPYQKDIYGVDPGYNDAAYHYVQVKLERPVTGFFASLAGIKSFFDVTARAVASTLPEEAINTSTNTISTPDSYSTVTNPDSTLTTTNPGSTITTTTPYIYDADYNGDEPHVTANTGCGFPGIEFNNEVLNAPFISRGNVCLRGSAPGGQLLAGGPTGRIDIQGLLGLFTSANRVAAVQGGTTPIAIAQIGGGCKYLSGATVIPCTSAQHVYANTIGTSPQNLDRPTFNWSAEYNKAAPGPLHPCDPTLLNVGESAGTPPTFDNNTTYNASLTTAVDITPAASYICRARDASGNVGELSWDSGTKKLTVAGVIFFDATKFSAAASSTISAPIHYYGKATIFVASNSQGLFNEKWCSGGSIGVDCSVPVSDMPNWDPSQNALWIVLGGGATGATVGNGSTDIDFKAPSVFQGVLYTVNTCHVHGAGAYISGPLICGFMNTAGVGDSALKFPPVQQLDGGGTTTTTVTPGSTVTTTTPGSTITTTTPGSTSTIISTSTVVTGTTYGIDE